VSGCLDFTFSCIGLMGCSNPHTTKHLSTGVSCPTHPLQLSGMPLAYPTSTTTTTNYGEEMLVVTFMTADAGEAFTDFTHRVEHPRQTVWGQRGPRGSRDEMIFDRESATRLVDLLGSYLDDRSVP